MRTLTYTCTSTTAYLRTPSGLCSKCFSIIDSHGNITQGYQTMLPCTQKRPQRRGCLLMRASFKHLAHMVWTCVYVCVACQSMYTKEAAAGAAGFLAHLLLCGMFVIMCSRVCACACVRVCVCVFVLACTQKTAARRQSYGVSWGDI